MELKELQTLWQESGKRPGENNVINQAVFSELSTTRIKSRLGTWKWSTLFEIVMSLIFINFLADFMLRHADSAELLLPAGFLALFSVLSIGLGIFKLVTYLQIDVHKSVVETQKRVEQLRYLSLWETKALYVVIPLFWVAFLIVGAQALFGYDMFQHSNYLLQSFAGSVVIAIIVVFFLRKYPDSRLQEASAFLRDIKEAE